MNETGWKRQEDGRIGNIEPAGDIVHRPCVRSSVADSPRMGKPEGELGGSEPLDSTVFRVYSIHLHITQFPASIIKKACFSFDCSEQPTEKLK